MIAATVEPTFAAWRSKARELLQQGVPPSEVVWCDATQSPSLLQEEPALIATAPATAVKVPADFLPLAASVCAHTDERRWSVLYRLLYRLTHGREKHLLAMPTDTDTRQCQAWAKAVGRDIHKMHAFVRFRLVDTHPETGREQFVAWFEPTYRIVRLATPFFEKRFAGMDWSILTPDECAHWDGHTLRFTPGLNRSLAPDADAHDDLWRTYYRSIFNPARIKVQAMKSEMPQKYWHNLPEAELIPELLAQGRKREQSMLAKPGRPALPVPDNAYLKALHERKD
jgi:DNA polymerase